MRRDRNRRGHRRRRRPETEAEIVDEVRRRAYYRRHFWRRVFANLPFLLIALCGAVLMWVFMLRPQ